MKIGQKIVQFTKEHGATILSWMASFGTVTGAGLAAKAMPKAQERIHEAWQQKKDTLTSQALESEDSQAALRELTQKGVKLTPWETIKAGGPAFIPAAIVEVATIGCIHGSNHLNQKEIQFQRSEAKRLAEAAGAAMTAYAAFQENVRKLDETTAVAAEIMADKQKDDRTPWDEKRIFYIDGQPEFFERTMEEVFKAEMELNRAFNIMGYATVNDFYRLLKLPTIPDGDLRGWHDYIGEVYFGYRWIDFGHEDYIPDGADYIVTEIKMYIEPHSLDEDEVNAELDAAIAKLNKQMIGNRGYQIAEAKVMDRICDHAVTKGEF